MTSKASTVQEYLASLPDDRKDAVVAVRTEILKRLPKGFEEGMLYGMIGYFVPHSLFPAGYHCDPKQPLMYAALGNQKNYMSIYLMCIYGDLGSSNGFVEAYKKTGKKLDMGKACVRFTKLENLALDVIGDAIASVPCDVYVARYVKILADQAAKKKKK